MKNQPWPEDRRRELDRMGKLFRLAGKLNHSSGIAENIIALDALVTELGHDDLKNCRQSFMNWLEKEATGQ